MNKIYLFLISLLYVVSSYASPSTPAAVNTFYGGMKKLAEAQNNQSAEDILSSMRKCFYGFEDTGINIPNDFRHFDYDSVSISHYDDYLSSYCYIEKLSIYIYYERVMSFSYRIIKNEEITFGSDKKDKESLPIMISIVKKSYKINGQAYTFNDSVYTNMKTGLIMRIKNSVCFDEVEDNASCFKSLKKYNYQNKLYEEACCSLERINKLFIWRNKKEFI